MNTIPKVQDLPDAKVRTLYEAIQHDYDIGDYPTFYEKMRNPEKRRILFDAVSPEYDLGDFNTYSQKIESAYIPPADAMSTPASVPTVTQPIVPETPPEVSPAGLFPQPKAISELEPVPAQVSTTGVPETMHPIPQGEPAPENHKDAFKLYEATTTGLQRGIPQAMSMVGMGAQLLGKLIEKYNDPEYADAGMMVQGAKYTKIPYIDNVLKPVSKVLLKEGKESTKAWMGLAQKYAPNKEIQGSIVEKPQLLLDPRWWGYNLTSMGPSLGAAVMVGIAGGPVLGAVLGGLTGGLMEASGTYDDALKRGDTEDQALDKAAKMTMAAGALNAISLNRMLSPGAFTQLKRFLLNGSIEALTEYAEEPAEGLIFGEDWDTFKRRLIEGINVAPPSFVLGGLGGIGGAVAAKGEKEVEIPAGEPPKTVTEQITPVTELAPERPKLPSEAKVVPTTQEPTKAPEVTPAPSAKAVREAEPIVKKKAKKPAAEFKVGDVIDTQDNTNMTNPLTIRKIEGRSLYFTDAEGKEYSGFARSTARELIEGGRWIKVQKPTEAPVVPVAEKPVEPEKPVLKGYGTKELHTIANTINPEDYDYDVLGIRVVDDYYEDFNAKPGDKLPPSNEWVDGEQTDKELRGTSTVDLTYLKAGRAIEGKYLGKKLFLVGGYKGEWSDELGERIIKDAVVLKEIKPIAEKVAEKVPEKPAEKEVAEKPVVEKAVEEKLALTPEELEYAKKYGMRRLRQGEQTQEGDIGYVQPGAKKFTPQIGIKYNANNMHPLYRPLPELKAKAGKKVEVPVIKETKPEAPKEKVVRFEAGKKLNKEERTEVLKSVQDVYAGQIKTEKGLDKHGEVIYGYEYNPDLFVRSDITGKMLRHYIKLPDGKIAHPSELYPDITQSMVEKQFAEEAFKVKKEEKLKTEHDRTINEYSGDSTKEANELYLKRGGKYVDAKGNIKTELWYNKETGKYFRADDRIEYKDLLREKGYEVTAPKGEVTPAEYFYVSVGDKNVEVIKNPTNEDTRKLSDEFNKEYPQAEKGQSKYPWKVRTTYDKDGNKYVWRADLGTHPVVEEKINKKFNTVTNQKKEFLPAEKPIGGKPETKKYLKSNNITTDYSTPPFYKKLSGVRDNKLSKIEADNLLIDRIKFEKTLPQSVYGGNEPVRFYRGGTKSKTDNPLWFSDNPTVASWRATLHGDTIAEGYLNQPPKIITDWPSGLEAGSDKGSELMGDYLKEIENNDEIAILVKNVYESGYKTNVLIVGAKAKMISANPQWPRSGAGTLGINLEDIRNNIKKVTEKVTPEKINYQDYGLQRGNAEFIQKKIKGLGTVEAVNAKYDTESKIDKYARAIAPEILGVEGVGVGKPEAKELPWEVIKDPYNTGSENWYLYDKQENRHIGKTYNTEKQAKDALDNMRQSTERFVKTDRIPEADYIDTIIKLRSANTITRGNYYYVSRNRDGSINFDKSGKLYDGGRGKWYVGGEDNIKAKAVIKAPKTGFGSKLSSVTIEEYEKLQAKPETKPPVSKVKPKETLYEKGKREFGEKKAKPEAVAPKAEVFEPFEANKSNSKQQIMALNNAVVGQGEYKAGEVYQQYIEAIDKVRPVQITKVNDDGTIDGWYLGSGYKEEIKFYKDVANLLPGQWSKAELEIPQFSQAQLEEFISKIFKAEKAVPKAEEKAPEVEIGDWITDGVIRGKVVGEGTIGKNIPAFKIDKGGGKITAIPKEQAELWVKGEEEPIIETGKESAQLRHLRENPDSDYAETILPIVDNWNNAKKKEFVDAVNEGDIKKANKMAELRETGYQSRGIRTQLYDILSEQLGIKKPKTIFTRLDIINKQLRNESVQESLPEELQNINYGDMTNVQRGKLYKALSNPSNDTAYDLKERLETISVPYSEEELNKINVSKNYLFTGLETRPALMSPKSGFYATNGHWLIKDMKEAKQLRDAFWKNQAKTKTAKEIKELKELQPPKYEQVIPSKEDIKTKRPLFEQMLVRKPDKYEILVSDGKQQWLLDAKYYRWIRKTFPDAKPYSVFEENTKAVAFLRGNTLKAILMPYRIDADYNLPSPDYKPGQKIEPKLPEKEKRLTREEGFVILPQIRKPHEQELAEKRMEQPFELKPETRMQALRRHIQDKMIRLEYVQRQIGISEAVEEEPKDVYLQAELYIGRAADKIQKLEKEFLEGDKSFLKRLYDDGFTIEEMGEYLLAKHAKERNAHIQEINPKFKQGDSITESGGSGISDAEADKILEVYGKTDIDKYAREVYANITKRALKIRLDSGDIDKETHDRLTSFYKNYVPLKGKAETEKYPNIGKGFSVAGKGIRRARGRRSLPSNPLIQAFVDLEEATIRSEKIKVGQSLLKLVREHPSEYWEVEKLKYLPRYDKNGEIQYLDPKYKFADNVIDVKEEGKTLLITIHDKAMVDGLKNMGLGRGVKYLNNINQYLRYVATVANPEFIVTNFERDLQTALVHLTGEQTSKIAKDTVKDIPKAMKGIWKNIRDKEGGAWLDLYAELKERGGKVGWFDQGTIEERTAKFEKKLRTYRHANNFEKAAHESLQFISDLNEVVESGVRLAAYKNLTKNGVSKNRAAQIAKNLTVNFNKKGTVGATINSVYMFSNAGIQGTARIFKAMGIPFKPKTRGQKRVQKIVLGIVAASFLQSMINRLIDEDDYERMAPYVKDNYWIFMLPNHRSLSIKVPYGYNIFKVVGNLAEEYAFGDISFPEAGSRLLIATNDAFNPLSGGTFAQILSPTAFDPIISLTENKNWFGGKIRPDQPAYQPKIPRSQLYFKSVRKTTKTFTDWLNKVTGGDEETSGLIDVSPEDVDFTIDFLGGGLGKFITNTIDTGKSLLIKGEFPEIRNIPMIRQFIKKPSEYQDRQIIYNMMDESKRTQYSVDQIIRFNNTLNRAVKNGEIEKKKKPKLSSDFIKNQFSSRQFSKRDREILWNALDDAVKRKEMSNFDAIQTKSEFNFYQTKMNIAKGK